MSGLSSDLLSPSWWFTVIVAGLLVNILAAYLKPRLDRVFARFSQRMLQRTEAVQAARAQSIARLRSSSTELVLEAVRETRLRLAGLLQLNLGFLGMLFYYFLPPAEVAAHSAAVSAMLTFSGILVALALRNGWHALEAHDVITEARKNQK